MFNVFAALMVDNKNPTPIIKLHCFAAFGKNTEVEKCSRLIQASSDFLFWLFLNLILKNRRSLKARNDLLDSTLIQYDPGMFLLSSNNPRRMTVGTKSPTRVQSL